MKTTITSVKQQNVESIPKSVKDDTPNLEEQIDPVSTIDMFAGPALLVDQELNCLHHNFQANSLLESLNHQDPLLRSLVTRTVRNQCPDFQKAALNDSKGLRHYDLYAFPTIESEENPDTNVLLIARETTVEHNLTNALVESRQMFKDLVSCSSDFAWETDNKGHFKYVSPRGILGYTAYELNGKYAADLIIDGEGKNPFDTLDHIQDMELWVHHNNGEPACLQVSAVPILDSNANWQGARGVCHDITVTREREAALRRIRNREQILNRIVMTMRDSTDAQRMFDATADIILENSRSELCYFAEKHTRNHDDKTEINVRTLKSARKDPEFINQLNEYALTAWQKDTMAEVKQIQLASKKILAVQTSFQNAANGIFFLVRDEKQADWTNDDVTLFNTVADHLGIALAQVQGREELERLSNTDELTGLMNRRSFYQQVTKRILHQQRSRENCSILYIDLDNFKTVNDTLGHGIGDEVLKKVSLIMSASSRVGDLCARLGGDEFAIWLENIDVTETVKKAEEMIAQKTLLHQITGKLDPNVSLSVGICPSDPDALHTVEQLLEAADNALYDVKKSGKGAAALADVKQLTKSQKTKLEAKGTFSE